MFQSIKDTFLQLLVKKECKTCSTNIIYSY